MALFKAMRYGGSAGRAEPFNPPPPLRGTRGVSNNSPVNVCSIDRFSDRCGHHSRSAPRRRDKTRDIKRHKKTHKTKDKIKDEMRNETRKDDLV